MSLSAPVCASGAPPELQEEQGAGQGGSELLTEQHCAIPKSLRDPNSSISHPKRGSAALFADPHARGWGHQHCSPSQRWHLPDLQQDPTPRTRCCTAGPPQIPGEKHQGMEAPAQNIQRSSSWGSDRGKSIPVTLPHVYFVCICTLARADSDRGCSGHSGNVTTHRPLLDSSSRNSLWEEERGATLPAPKSAHSWAEEMLSQLRGSIQDLLP